jgi:hypothetical protein
MIQSVVNSLLYYAMASDGYVYCFSNPSMPGIVKIGMTERNPILRLAEANRPYTWSPPTPYVLEFAKHVKNPKKKEGHIHNFLGKVATRIHPRREFFRISTEIVRGIFDIIDGEMYAESTHAEVVTEIEKDDNVEEEPHVEPTEEDIEKVHDDKAEEAESYLNDDAKGEVEYNAVIAQEVRDDKVEEVPNDDMEDKITYVVEEGCESIIEEKTTVDNDGDDDMEDKITYVVEEGCASIIEEETTVDNDGDNDTEDELEEERDVVVEDIVFRCTKCNYSTNKHCNYNRHLNTRKHSSLKKPKTKCSICGKEYINTCNLNKHKTDCIKKQMLQYIKDAQLIQNSLVKRFEEHEKYMSDGRKSTVALIQSYFPNYTYNV